MTDLRKAAEKLLEALDDGWVQRDDLVAITLRQALAQPEQEPVAWEKSYGVACALLRQAHDILAMTQYPIKRPWVSLTDEEIENLELPNKPTVKEFVQFIESALRSKNNG